MIVVSTREVQDITTSYKISMRACNMGIQMMMMGAVAG